MQNPLIGRPFWQKLLALMCVYFLLAGIFYWVVADDWHVAAVSTDAVNPSDRPDPADDDSLLIRQTFPAAMDRLEGVALQPLIYDECDGEQMKVSLCDRVLWLDHGQIRMIGSTDEVCGAYAAHMAANGQKA